MIIAHDRQGVHKAAIDPFTVTHFAAGLTLGMWRVGLPVALAGALAWELLERGFARTEAGLRFFPAGPETAPNVAVDVATMAIGWALGRSFMGKDARPVFG